MCPVLVSFATVLRLHRLGRWSLWLDEFIQYMESALPLNKLHEALLAQEVPISFLFEHMFVAMGFDHNEWQLRLDYAVVGVATVVLVSLPRSCLDGELAFWLGSWPATCLCL